MVVTNDDSKGRVAHPTWNSLRETELKCQYKHLGHGLPSTESRKSLLLSQGSGFIFPLNIFRVWPIRGPQPASDASLFPGTPRGAGSPLAQPHPCAGRDHSIFSIAPLTPQRQEPSPDPGRRTRWLKADQKQSQHSPRW